MEEEQYKMYKSTGFKVTVIILLLLLIALTGYVCYYAMYSSQRITFQGFVKPTVENSEPTMYTVDDAVTEFREIQEYEKAYSVFIKLPEIVVKEIYSRLGADADVVAVAKEYQQHKREYITLMIQNKVKFLEIEGPDADNVESVGLDIKLKPEQAKTVPVIPDTIP